MVMNKKVCFFCNSSLDLFLICFYLIDDEVKYSLVEVASIIVSSALQDEMARNDDDGIIINNKNSN